MEFVSRQLQEGINLWVWQTEKFKNVSIKIVLHRHLADATSANALLPFVMSRGTEKWTSTRDIAIHMADLYGTQYGLDVMKIGEQQLLVTEVEVVNPRYVSDETVLEAALEAAVQLALYPNLVDGQFVPQYVELERNMMRQRIASLINNKRGLARQRFNETMFAGEAASLYKYGSPEDLQELDANKLTEHFRRVRATAPVNVFVAGDVKADQIADKLAAMLPRRTEPAAAIPEAVIKGEAGDVKVISETQEVSQAVLLLGYRTGITPKDPLYYAGMVANGVLGGFPHSKLFLNVREKASLAYYASSSLDTTKGVLVATAGIDPKNYHRAVDIIKEQVAALQAGQVSAGELEATKMGLANWMHSLHDSAGAAIDRTLAGIVRGAVNPVDDVVAGIESVSSDEVVAAAQRFQLDTIYCLTNEANSDPDKQQEGRG